MIFEKVSVKNAYCIAFFVLLVDQISKYFFKNYGEIVTNTGAAFGILKDSRIFLIVVSVVALFFILKYFEYSPFAMGLLLGGCVGNLIDRLVFGYVIDFIDVGFWPVFNIADSANTLGFLLLAWKLFREK